MSTVDLDEVATMERFDPGGMERRIAELPRQCREAMDLAKSLRFPEHYADADSIVILGLGGSAIGGDLVRTLVEQRCPVPLLINRDYGIPGFVNSHTLVLASSYSGNTEEVLTAVGAALGRDAMCLAITTGGELATLCSSRGLPVFRFDYESQPRAALGYSFTSLLVLLERLGFVADIAEPLGAALMALEKLGSVFGLNVPEANNPAKQLARRLEGRLPVIYGAGHLSEVARRWKCQFNENSKGWAFWEVAPELNHNAVAGYEFPEALRGNLHVLLLDSDLYRQSHRARMQITGEILRRREIAHEFVNVRGESTISQVLWAIHLGDYVSYYLAALRGVDPTPVESIAYLKERLAEGK
ncbi:MAG TPA: bifunctional phosphoglucose/phosphomannose isomerase [Chloroflexi bacterium]|nr:bifunctional phosphoglucose/phosphomannose isomerase [Chloroflexota bacterium]